MKKFNLLKKLAIQATGLIAGLLIVTGTAHAIPYTGPTTPPSPVPAFNVFTGNNLPAPMPTDGEQDFFQGRVPVGGNINDPTTPFTDPVNSDCTNGQIVQLHIYVHNGASQYDNNNGTGPSVMHGAQVKVALPSATQKATQFQPVATLSANNAASASDSVTINCNGSPVELQYVPGSASQYSIGSGVVPLSDNIVSTGVPIQSEKVPGDVWGCWNERVYVILQVKVVVPPTPKSIPPTCDLLKVEASGQVAKLDLNYTPNDAKDVTISVDFGNGVVEVLQPSQFPFTYQYPAAGNYTITATVKSSNFAPVTSDTCKGVVSSTTPPITPPTTPPVTPATPTELINTGPGSLVGIFAATAIAAGVTRHLYKTRRLFFKNVK